MFRIRLFVDYEKEEKWLEGLLAKGYQLKSIAFGYYFKKTEPEECKIRIDNRSFASKEDYMDYLALFDDSGWQHIAGKRHSGVQYFKQKNIDGAEDIFSDGTSIAIRYRNSALTWITLASLYLFMVIMQFLQGNITISSFYDIKGLYYTPGLWERTGIAFWKAFLFETPFVFLRSFLFLFMLGFGIAFAIFAYRASRIAKRKETEGF